MLNTTTTTNNNNNHDLIGSSRCLNNTSEVVHYSTTHIAYTACSCVYIYIYIIYIYIYICILVINISCDLLILSKLGSSRCLNVVYEYS